VKCWVCSRQARGFGHSDGRFRIADPRRYPLDWVFCSRRCQDTFHQLYGSWVARDPTKQEDFMIDPSDAELAAMKQCLKAFGGAASEIGFQKPLGDYSEKEALRVVDAIVTCYTEAMIEHHEATRHPPIRGLRAPEANAFSDLKDDLPWENAP
jgi:hypothetical protein